MKHEEMIKERKVHMKQTLLALIGDGCEEENFRPLKEDTAKMVLEVAEKVVEGEIQKATIVVDGTTITIRGGDKIKVARSMKYEQGSQV